ncbi:MAG: bifunctional 4-hydroxy-2-oxoglutarate aldolase/2-dehydro-3-deoxy-phosphogluconate aldolase [Cyclobacteriaceae bacterium]|nr:bifunctional 4-hydroxy-2-oxoglutarate aldolase/2-dehydro-3-deoxy-phosphogluconate aldolase [Cyclobacteriaceae bacterium]
MAFTKEQIVATLKNTGIVPLFSHDDARIVLKVVEALYKGGARVFEFTNRRTNSFEVFKQLVAHADDFPEMALGVGTIMDAATTQKFIDAGADLIVAPILKTEMAAVCHAHHKLWVPGCATLTEIVTAKEAGAEVIKVFPGSVMGPGFVSAIMPVAPGLQLMITGGVEPAEQNLSAWFKAGATCVGLGSQLITNSIIQNNEWEALQDKTAEAVALVQQVKSKKAIN